MWRPPYVMHYCTIKMKWSFRDGTNYSDGHPASLQGRDGGLKFAVMERMKILKNMMRNSAMPFYRR